MDRIFEVHSYDVVTLERVIADKSGSSPEVISKKLHRDYFEGYFDFISAKTIVVENDYFDRDYLDDFAGYYVRCFERYDRVCTRFHFFSTAFSSKDFSKFLCGDINGISSDSLSESYLGFIVLKPLPQTLIGRTCLKTYPPEGRRHFPITRPYHANLYGLDLTVDSLAFQEQDQVVAACATSALWSVFQGTGLLFQHQILSPFAITEAASERFPVEERTLPNRGLTTAMMVHAIRRLGLEPHLVNVSEEYVLKGTLYAYLRGHIPMILGIELIDTSKKDPRSLGYHAIAITGYSTGLNVSEPFGVTDFLLGASRIDKIYVHDDQVGPFARMALDKQTVLLKQEGKRKRTRHNSLSTSWRGSDGTIGTVRAVPTILLIPVYHKIRIPYGVVHDAVVSFDRFLEAFKTVGLPYSDRLEWDIFLTTVNEFKSEIRSSSELVGENRKRILLEPMPRFMWRATALSAGALMLDLLFDATDIEQGRFFVGAIEYNEDLAVMLRIVAREPTIEKAYKVTPEWKIIQWFRDQPV